jgi:hypothetical protein
VIGFVGPTFAIDLGGCPDAAMTPADLIETRFLDKIEANLR